MKKIFTLFLATVVALSIWALPLQTNGLKGQVKQPTERTQKQPTAFEKISSLAELPRVAVPTTHDAPQRIASKATPKTQLAAELVSLNFDKISAGPTYNEESGDWWIGLGCDDETRPEYGHIIYLDWFAPADNMCGTFTTKDFDLSFSYMYTTYCMGAIVFDSISMTVKYEKVSPHLEVLMLDAVLYGSDGFAEYGFDIHVEQKTFVPKGDVQLTIPAATITADEMGFVVAGTEGDVALNLAVNSYNGVTGTFMQNAINWDASTITYKGVALAPIEAGLKIGVEEAVPSGKLAYAGVLSMLATDTVQYTIAFVSPMPDPVDTIDVVCPNFEATDSWAAMTGEIEFAASNAEYEISGGWKGEVLEAGTYTLPDARISLWSNVTYQSVSPLTLTLNVSQDAEGEWAVKGNMLGNDNVVYNLDLSWNVPVPTDTVKVAFDNSAKARFYPDMDNDFMLFNENDQYYASIDIFGIEVGGSFTDDNMDMWFSRLEVYNPEWESKEQIEIAEVRNGLLNQVGDTTILQAELFTFEGIMYDVYLWYVTSTPTEVVDITYENASFINNMEYESKYSLLAYAPDSLTVFCITMNAMTEDEVPGTYVNDGKFGEFGKGQYDFDGSNTYYGVWNAEMEEFTLIYVQKGQVVVEMDDKKNITLKGELIFEDAVQRNITMKAKIEKPRLPYDATEGEVNRSFNEEDILYTEDKSADYGLIYMQVASPDYFDIFQIALISTTSDPDIVLPEGTYEFSNSWESNTALAGSGVSQDGSVAPSFYGTVNDEGMLLEPLYFMVEGTVVVSKNDAGKLHVEINALNSYDVPIHIVYDAGNGSAVENIETDAPAAQKVMKDGQLLIIHNGETYNAMGVMMK